MRFAVTPILLCLPLAAAAQAPKPAAPPAARRPAAAAPADTALKVDPAVTIGKLPNGLTYYIRVNHRPEKRAELRLVVNAGSIQEDDDQRGLAHFTEHMAFNGTTHFKKQELVDYIESIGMRFGADLNAGTSFDETSYQLQVPTDSAQILRQAFQILEDWSRGVTFDTTEVRKERGVVLEEWRLGRGAGQRMFDKQLPVLFRGSRYVQRLPIGTPECIRTCPAAAMRRFYRDWYRPDLMAVVAVGDFDPKAVEALIRAHWGAIPKRAVARPRVAALVPRRTDPGVSIATDPEATSTTVSVYLQRAPGKAGTTRAWRNDLLENLASTMVNRRLDELAQKPNPPFIGAGAGRSSLVRTSEAFTFGAAVPDSGVRRGLEAVLTELERAGRHGFTQSELDRTRADYLRGLEQAFAERDKSESNGFAEEYVNHFLTGEGIPGITYDYLQTKLELPDVTVADLNAVARGWLATGAPVILVDAPEKSRAAIPTPEALLGIFAGVKRADIPAYTETVSAEELVPASVTPGRITAERRDSVLGTLEWTLSNGARVVLKPTDFKADQLLFLATAPGGYSLAPEPMLSSAQLAAQIVSVSGLGAFSAVDLQKKLAGKAVSLSPYVSAYEEGVSGEGSPQDAETLFQLAWLHFAAPRLDSAAVTAFTQNVRAALANRGASPQVAFSDTLGALLASHHRWARPLSTRIVDELDPAQSLAFYRARFRNAGAFTFFVVGAFDPAAIRPLVERYLASLPSEGPAERYADPGIRRPEGVVQAVVRRGIEPKAQTAIVFTGPATATPEERFLLDALGDVLEIRLREQLREELGGTYSVNVSASATRIPHGEYTVSVSFGSAPERADSLAAAVFAEIDSLAARGPRPEDLAKVKEADIRSRETNLRQNGWWLGLLSSSARDGENPAPRLDLAAQLAKVTPGALQAAARTYLGAGRYVRVTLLPDQNVP